MHYLAPAAADLAPLDFNAPVRTESVADALVSDPSVPEVSPSDARSLLADLGLPARTVSEILPASSSSRAF
ncbi:MAG: hypothetical protein OXI74_02045 [Rhodospirillaceae bacterium]|nr:hypothetical protein [Rhodospirillaceae bacterium]